MSLPLACSRRLGDRCRLTCQSGAAATIPARCRHLPVGVVAEAAGSCLGAPVWKAKGGRKGDGPRFALIRKASSPTLPASADGGGEKLAASTAPKRTRDRLSPSPPHAVMRALAGGGHHVRSAEPFRTGQAGRPGTVRAARQR